MHSLEVIKTRNEKAMEDYNRDILATASGLITEMVDAGIIEVVDADTEKAAA